jgi:hypothetical protein
VTASRAACSASTPVARFRNDLHRRYPARPDRTAVRVAASPGAGKPFTHRLEKLPPEIGVLLIAVGTAGVLLPGPVGTPFLLAGGVALWPSAFRKAEAWFERVSPRLCEEGVRQMERFLSDLERRYPGSTA